MNVYDAANELGRAMRESQEYKRLSEAKKKLAQMLRQNLWLKIS